MAVSWPADFAIILEKKWEQKNLKNYYKERNMLQYNVTIGFEPNISVRILYRVSETTLANLFDETS